MSMKKLHRSEQGLSLLEVIIAGGLVMALSLVLATLNSDTMRAARSVALVNDYNSISSGIYQMLADPLSCRDFLTTTPQIGTLTPGAGGYPIDINTVTANGQTFATKTAAPQGGLWIKRIYIHRLPGDSGTDNPDLGVLSTGETAFVVTLRLEAERIGDNKQLPGAKTLIRDFPIRVASTGGGVITDCYRDPGIRTLCTALGANLNPVMQQARGMLCDLGPEVCRQLGGTWNAGANPPCDYSPGGVAPPPLVNVTQRVCLDLGGTYTGGVPACRFGFNQDTGLTSITAACASYGGVLRPGFAPAKCDFCAANGGEWNPGFNGGLGGCDFNRRPCEQRGTVAHPAIYDPVTTLCNSADADCERLGGVYMANPGSTPKCHIPHKRGACHSGTIGWDTKHNNDAWQPFGWYCAADEYVADVRGWSRRWDDDNVEEAQVEVLCCKNGP